MLDIFQTLRKRRPAHECAVCSNEIEGWAAAITSKKLFKVASGNQSQSQTTTTTTSKPKRRIDPSVWDDLLKLGGISSGSSSSSSSSSLSKPKATCYFTGEETVVHNKSCRYSCTGSIDTITISAMEICPLHIQR